MKYGFISEVPEGEKPPVEEWLKKIEAAVGHPVSKDDLTVRAAPYPVRGATFYQVQYICNGPQVKDSGDRPEFTSGAVRDMHEGKGRCDLLPMCALLRLARHYEAGCKKYGDRNWEKGIPAHSFADNALRHMLKYMDGMDDEDHLIAAVWNLLGLAYTEEKHPEMMDIPARAGKADFTKMYVKVGT